jgi:hypothetical protein
MLQVRGADDAVDDSHAANHECSHHIAIRAARWPSSGCRISAPDIARTAWGKLDADVRPNFPKGKKGGTG